MDASRTHHLSWIDPCASVFICGLLLSGCAGPAAKTENAGGGVATMGAVAATHTAPNAEATVESVEPWSYNSAEGRIVRTAHYRLFTTQPETVLSERVPLFLESALGAYRT